METKAKRDQKTPAVKLPRGQRAVKKSSKGNECDSVGDILASVSSSRLNLEHPLLNAMLVSKIIPLMNPDFETFQQLRLVCKTWHDATLHQWRKTAVLRIVPDATPFNGKRYNGISFLESLQELQDPQSPFQMLQKPFSKYKLVGFDINVIVCEDPLSKANQFWNQFGPLMEYIHLEKCTIRDTRHRALAQLLVKHVPNATELVLSKVKLDEEKVLQRRRSFKEIHPNLKTLTVYGNNRMGLCGLLKLAPQLQTVRGYDQLNNQMNYYSLVHAIYNAKAFNTKSPQSTAQLLSQLKHLDMLHSSAFMRCRFRDFVELGQDIKLKLETLAVQLSPNPFFNAVRPGDHMDGNIDPFLKSLSGTLKTLTVFRAPLGQPFPTFLCQAKMTALTELHLLGTVASNFYFLEYTPNLKKLRIDLGCFEHRDEIIELLRRGQGNPRMRYGKNKKDMTAALFWLENIPFRNLKLEHFEIDYLFRDIRSWKLLGKLMPNLKTLKTIVNTRIVPAIYQQWKGLTELVCLHGSSLSNSDFFTEENKFASKKDVKNISDLKGLKKFQLDAICGESKLADSSVFKGLLNMPSLTTVQICVNHRMTSKAEEALKKGVEFCRVIRNYAEPGGSNADYDCCARVAFATEVRLGVLPRIDVEEILEINESEESDMD